MSKVYIVTSGEYSDYHIDAVFTEREKAEQYCAVNNKCGEYSDFHNWVHAIDLQGYGTQQFTGARTNIIAGWSEKVFDFINLAEQGEGTLEKTIAAYQW